MTDKTTNDASWSKAGADHRTDFEKPASPLPKRIAAVVLWILGMAVELAAILTVTGDIPFVPEGAPRWMVLGAGIVIAAALSICGTSVWRKASKAKGSKNQSAVAIALATLAFAPMVLFFVVAKNASKVTKVASVIAACAFSVLATCLAILI